MNLEKTEHLVLVEDSVGPKSIILANNLRNHQEGHESCNNTQTVGMSAPKGKHHATHSKPHYMAVYIYQS